MPVKCLVVVQCRDRDDTLCMFIVMSSTMISIGILLYYLMNFTLFLSTEMYDSRFTISIFNEYNNYTTSIQTSEKDSFVCFE